MSWQLLLEFVVSTAYGVLSALIPIFNSEIYIAASQVGGFAEEVTAAIGCALGLASARSARSSPCVGAPLSSGSGGYAIAPGNRPGRSGRRCEAGRTA